MIPSHSRNAEMLSVYYRYKLLSVRTNTVANMTKNVIIILYLGGKQ